MTDKTLVGLDAEEISAAPKRKPITKVIVSNGENEWSSGDNTGDSLSVEIPVATASNGETLAGNILAKVRGYAYQPYDASGALVEPAAEIGDGITIGSVYGCISAQNIDFSKGALSEVSAPYEQEVDSEYPFLSAADRDKLRQKRQMAKNTSDIETHTTEIAANTDNIADNARDISNVSTRVTSLEADHVSTASLNAATARISTLEGKTATFSNIFSGASTANYCKATTINAVSNFYFKGYTCGVRRILTGDGLYVYIVSAESGQ